MLTAVDADVGRRLRWGCVAGRFGRWGVDPGAQMSSLAGDVVGAVVAGGGLVDNYSVHVYMSALLLPSVCWLRISIFQLHALVAKANWLDPSSESSNPSSPDGAAGAFTLSSSLHRPPGPLPGRSDSTDLGSLSYYLCAGAPVNFTCINWVTEV
jgi:hypothetical protein